VNGTQPTNATPHKNLTIVCNYSLVADMIQLSAKKTTNKYFFMCKVVLVQNQLGLPFKFKINKTLAFSLLFLVIIEVSSLGLVPTSAFIVSQQQ
jgi:hypothetical protein